VNAGVDQATGKKRRIKESVASIKSAIRALKKREGGWRVTGDCQKKKIK